MEGLIWAIVALPIGLIAALLIHYSGPIADTIIRRLRRRFRKAVTA